MNLRRNLSKYLALYSYVEAYRSNKLPEGYTRLSYIQGDGTAYIDLGLSLTQNDNIEIDFIAKYTTSAQIFGYRDGPSSNNILLFTGGGPNSIFLDFNNSNYVTYRASTTLTDNDEYKAILNKNIRQLLDSNGNVIAENTAVCSDTITTGNVYLFFANGIPSGNNKFTGSIKEVIISDRMDLIPCKDPNNNIGMYDTISGKFFGNSANSGAFIAGDEVTSNYLGNTIKLKDAIHSKLDELTLYGKTKNKAVDGLDSLIANGGTEFIPETYLDTVIAKGKCVQENRLTNGLPSDYQELYYIESTGTQYINTGIVVNSDTYVRIEFVIKNDISAGGAVFGARPTGGVGTGTQLGHGADAKIVVDWLSGTRFTSSEIFQKNIPYVAEVSNRVFTIKNANTGTVITTNTFSDGVNVDYTFALLGLNNGGTFIPSPDFIQLKSFVIKNANDNKSVNLIPVRRKSDNELGMYDTVSKTFFTNSGTGTFTASEDKLIDSTSSDYTILDYATFDGTQVVDTGVICNEESRIESKWMANSSSVWVYGTGADNPRITCYCVSSGNERFGNVTVDSTGITHGVLNTVIHDKNGFYYNGTNGKPYSNVGTFTCTNTLTIGNSNGSTGTPYFTGNFYYMRIYDNDVLVKSYIPVKRNSDDVVGFFDTVSSTFITPFEGNALVAGTVKTTWEPTPNFPVDIWCNNGKIDKSGDTIALPSDYTQLEYLESTGTQYIDTGIKGNQNNIIETKWMYYTESDIVTSGRIFGARYTSGSRNSFSIGSNTGKASTSTAVFAQLGDNSSLALNNIVIGQWDTYKLSADGFYIDDIKQGDLPAATFETPFTVKLFAFEQASSSSAASSIGCGVGRCKQFKVWNGDTLLQNLIPAKNSDNVVGMYDTVSGTFFTNQGTDEFIAGPIANTRNVQEVITAPNGKNLFDKNNIQRIYGYFNATGGKWAWATNGNSIKIPCKPNTKYTARYDDTFSVVVLGFGSTYTDDEPSSSNVFVPVTNSIRTPNPTKDTPVTITTGANDKWLIVAWPASELYPDQYEEMRQHLIVEEGETPTEYEAGKGFNTAKCKNLLSVGTYQDTQSILDGTITRNVGVLVLTGEETVGAGQSDNKFYIDFTDKIPNYPRSQDWLPICTHFAGQVGSLTGSGECNPDHTCFYTASSSSTIQLYMSISGSTKTNAQFKAWLADQYAAGTPVIIVYPLATPVTETTSSAILNKKEASVISGSLSISDLEVTNTESEHTVPTPLRPLSLRCNNGILKDIKLPYEYDELDYVENTGYSVIDTLKVPNANTKFVLDAQVVDRVTSSGSQVMFGNTESGWTTQSTIRMEPNIFRLRAYTSTSDTDTITSDTLRHTFIVDIKNGYSAIDNTTLATWISGFGTATSTLKLFGGYWNNTYQFFTKMKVYSAKIYEDNVLVMNLVPAKRKSDGVAGLYDTVGKSFFININPNGSNLTAGNIIPLIVGTQETIITVKETNLFDKNTVSYINAYVNATTGTLTQGTPGSSTQYCFVIPCKSNTTYKLDGMGTNLSAWGSFTDNTIGTIATTYIKGNNTLTTGPNDHYLIGLAYTTGTAIYDYRDTLNIREIDVIAYVQNLLAIDSTYVDTQNILTGLVTHTIGIKVLDGTENWTVYGSSIPGLIYSDTAITNNLIDAPVTSMICSHLQIDKTTTVIVGGIRFQGNVTTNKVTSGRVYIKANDTWSLAQTTQWLADQYAAGTPVIILYPLATATTESVDPQPMRNSPASIKDASMEGLTLTQTHSIHTTPTPDFPLDLVCNNGTIKGVSKNLFDPTPSNIVCGYWIRNNNSQLEASAQNFYTDYFMPVKPDTSYVAFGRKKSDGTLSNYNRIAWYDSSKTWIRNSTYTQGIIGTDTSPSNAAYARFHCNPDGSVLTTDYVLEWNWMFYEGTEEESFVPYGIITEGNPEVLNIKGKNLYDITKDTTGKYINASGAIADSTAGCYSDLIPVIPGVAYTYSGVCGSGADSANVKRIHGYIDGVWNQQIVAQTISTTKPFNITFAVPAGINGIRISHWKNDENTQVEEGIRPTKYEEYMNVDYLVPTLLSAGDFVDTQELQSGIYNSKIGVKVLDGTEDWGEISNGRGYWFPIGVLQEIYTNVIGLCSHFDFYMWDDNTVPMPVNKFGFNKNSSIGKTNGNITFRPDLTIYNTVSAWKQYLADQYTAGTPVIIVYPLANTSTKTEESKHIHIDAGTNTITRISDTDELEMEVKYKKLK